MSIICDFSDSWASLKAKLEADFYADTSYTVNITFDDTYTLDTYTPDSVIDALTVGKKIAH